MKTLGTSLALVAALACAVWSCGDDSSDGSANTGGAGQDAGNDAAGASGSGGSAGIDGGPQQSSSKLDLVLVVDNSRNMGDKQAVFAKSIATLVSRLTNPRCVTGEGAPAATQPAAPDAACPSGSSREMAPVRDMHVGVVSSSLGGWGADICSGIFGLEEDDRGELIARGGATTYQDRGYLVWDPDQNASPPGESSAEALTNNLRALVSGAGEIGCGFEAPLEAFYRFLIDPEPPAAVVFENNSTVFQGTNDKLLTQRAQFLRPDSAVLIVILSDENDCSTYDGALGWLVRQGTTPDATIFTLPRATAECLTNPNSACCRSCTSAEASPPAGCQALSADPGCQPKFHDDVTDPLNLRCWDQKRRFGFDLLHPVDRYLRGLTAPTVTNRAGNQVPNPLFSAASGAAPRDPSLVSVAAIVGVPWQDLAKDPADSSGLRYMTAPELVTNDRWPAIVGDPAAGTQPLDPFMRESIVPRSGTNPITGDPIQPPSSSSATASPINGHEFETPSHNDLQYACIFPLPEPRVCPPTGSCECTFEPGSKPLCQAPDGSYGSTQYYAKAYPGVRQLDLLRRLGSQAIAASICPRNVSDPAREDYAHHPAVQAIVDRMKNVIE